MRTTLDIAEDVLQAAKERARREGKTAGQVISELARHSLTQTGAPSVAGVVESEAIYGFRPFPSEGPVVTDELINRLREDDAY
ncbi:MAG: Antitoxin VapB39 [Steroidobacteraceae bacterium]|nr:Antitoxin VapB39 [Steroidobacteraceae bacterium]